MWQPGLKKLSAENFLGTMQSGKIGAISKDEKNTVRNREEVRIYTYVLNTLERDYSRESSQCGHRFVESIYLFRLSISLFETTFVKRRSLRGSHNFHFQQTRRSRGRTEAGLRIMENCNETEICEEAAGRVSIGMELRGPRGGC
jgi:hypothetical protein